MIKLSVKTTKWTGLFVTMILGSMLVLDFDCNIFLSSHALKQLPQLWCNRPHGLFFPSQKNKITPESYTVVRESLAVFL